MYEIAIDEKSNFVEIRLSGTVSLEELRISEQELESKAPKASLCVLLDWSALEGWTEEAQNEKFQTQLRTRSGVEVVRAAVVAQPRWFSEYCRLRDIFARTTMEFFSPDEREEALSWLKEEPTDA